MTPRALTPFQAHSVASHASEDIRTLIRATYPADGFSCLRYPNDVYALLGSMTELAERLPQLLVQLSSFLQRQLQQDVLIVEDGNFRRDALGAVGTAGHQLEGAAVHAARELAAALSVARQAIAFVTHTGSGPGRG